MMRTIEGIIEAHSIANARRSFGLPSWANHVNLRDVFNDESLSFEERRDEIVRRLRASSWLRGRDEFEDPMEIIEWLAVAEDAEEFDELWDDLYDHADRERCWIGT